MTIKTQRAKIQELRKQGLTVYVNKTSKEYLSKFRFNPKTVFDIGVHRGTPWLYSTFQDAKLILIDPQKNVAQRVEALQKNNAYDMEFVNVAIGEERNTLTMNIPKQGSRASLLARTPLTQAPNEAYVTEQVEVLPLKELVETKKYQPSFGIKIDTEGYELEVLKGAASVLSDTEFVIAEVSVKERFIGSYRFSDVIQLLAKHEFELLDILGSPIITPRFIDCLFVNRNHRGFTSDL